MPKKPPEISLLTDEQIQEKSDRVGLPFRISEVRLFLEKGRFVEPYECALLQVAVRMLDRIVAAAKDGASPEQLDAILKQPDWLDEGKYKHEEK